MPYCLERRKRAILVFQYKTQREMILLSAVGVGVAVSAAGMIGFVGLVVPHIGRMLVGPDHRNLVPVSTLLGALMLTLADMVARVAVAPAELPIGIVTALVGAPFFLYLLFQQKVEYSDADYCNSRQGSLCHLRLSPSARSCGYHLALWRSRGVTRS